MQAKIQLIPAKKFIGVTFKMSFVTHNPFMLWNKFMPRRHEIKNAIGNELYSGEVYPPAFFENYNSNALFNKWAAVEVSNFDEIPEGMETLSLPEGLYAIFIYKGNNSGASAFYTKIFTEWLPSSGYKLDDRPHFAVMGANYKKDDPNSEEEIWIPVKTTNNN